MTTRNSTPESGLYSEPIRGIDLADCFFYHQMDLPEVGTVGTQWDIRQECEQYLGAFDFAGKRVLDVGAASGFLTFEMEKRGAEVVSFDMVDASQWDIIPRIETQQNIEEAIATRRNAHRMLRNAYWYAHEKLGSKAKVYLGNVYDLPLELGEFDVVFFGMILGHLQNPFQALYSASRLCREAIIVTNQTVPARRRQKNAPIAYFMPTADNGAVDCWWAMSDACIANMLDVLGFRTQKQIFSKPKCIVPGRQQVEVCTTTVTSRYAGAPAAGLTRAA